MSRMGGLLLGVFVLRGTFVFYPVVKFCFHGIIMFMGFGILHDGCGFWLQERILKVAEVVKRALTGTGEVCVFIPLFYMGSISKVTHGKYL